jgi:hypothetical protein
MQALSSNPNTAPHPPKTVKKKCKAYPNIKGNPFTLIGISETLGAQASLSINYL